MKYSFDLRQEAVMELLNSVIWYEEQQEGLGKRFRAAFQCRLEQICNDPHLYKKVHRNFHEALTDTFPFLIVYYIDDEQQKVIVISIFHTSRNPKKKFKKR
ncbi:MAG TPA: type II toxin-antitoxin system RelE/ParE family toxin [Mucilaginibacter sp.]